THRRCPVWTIRSTRAGSALGPEAPSHVAGVCPMGSGNATCLQRSRTRAPTADATADRVRACSAFQGRLTTCSAAVPVHTCLAPRVCGDSVDVVAPARSEEHTSELQSRFDLVCRLLLEKKKEDYNSTQLQE